jgi:hypothetical protein
MGSKFKQYLNFIGAISILIFWNSCRQDVMNFPDIPEISLTAVEVLKDVDDLDSILKISFTYQDGDGDIGLKDNDTFAPFNAGSLYQYNLWWDIFEVSNGNLSPVLDASRTSPEIFSLRTPDLSPTGKIKQISGEMSVKVNAYAIKLYPDSILCRLTLIDRSLNHSNTIETEVIHLVH